MADIFSNPYKNVETWTAQGAVVNYTVGTGSAVAVPLLMTNITVNYGRRVMPQYPINTSSSGSGKKINIAGVPSGTLQVGSIYGPTMTGLQQFIEAVAKQVKTAADQIGLTIRPFGTTVGNTTVNNSTLKLGGVELEQVALSLQGGETAIVNMPLTFSFTSLDWDFT